MKLMLLMTTKTARLQPPGGMRNDSWRVPVGFPTPSDYKGAGKPTVDSQMRLWGAAGGYNGPKCAILGKVSFLVSRLLESGKKAPDTTLYRFANTIRCSL